jgi:predicted short-subunit dehydrogenase-like oxidoreductase (DUF2520 family)
MGFSVVMIGAGNVATHLSKRLNETGIRILQVFSRTEKSARTLAERVNAEWITNIEMIHTSADIYILALKDSAIVSFLENSQLQGKMLVHCSGTLSIDVLKDYSPYAGVLYPLQTFSKARDIDFSEVPLFLEYSTSEVEKVLDKMARMLTSRIYYANSHQRMILHIAAVFSCNFVNHFYAIAEQILNENNLDFEYLLPLMQETLDKTKILKPFDAQTGPAVRNDLNITDRHIRLLSGHPEIQNLYSLISEHIYKLHQK